MKHFSRITTVCLLLMFLATGFQPLLAQKTWTGFTKTTPTEPVITVTQSTTSAVIFTVETPGMYTEPVTQSGVTYQRVSLPACGTSETTGSPELPVIKRMVAIPESSSITITVVPGTAQPFSNKTVYPHPDYQQVTNPDGTSYMQEVFSIDAQAYATNAFTPGIYAEIKEIGYMRNQRVAEVWVYPLQYNPVTKELKAYPNMQVTLTIAGATSTVCKNTGLFGQVCSHTLINYGTSEVNQPVIANDNGQGSVNWVTVNNTSGLIEADYIIVAASGFFTPHNAALLQLANHRAAFNGFDVAIVDVANVISSYYDVGNAPYEQEVAIHDFLKSVWENGSAQHTFDGKLAYVLLVGDDNYAAGYDLPIGQFRLQNTAINRISDNYYSRLTLTEYGNPDIWPEVYIGRVSVHNTQDLQTVVTKTIGLESETTNTDYKKKMLLVGGKEDPYADENIEHIETIIPTSYLNQTIKEYEIGTITAKQELISAINQNLFLITYSGHGNPISWSGELMNPTEFEQLSNTKYPVVFSMACHTGMFDGYYNCMAEFFNNSSVSGSVLFIACPRASVSSISGPLSYKLNTNFLNNYIYEAGALLWTSSNFFDSDETTPFEIYGDPALNLTTEGSNIDYAYLTGDVLISNHLIVNSGGTLDMHNARNVFFTSNGKLTINSGAIFILPNGSIYCSNSMNNTIQVNGTIQINNDVTIQNCNLILNGTISAEPGATLTISGSGKTTKLLEVQKSIAFDTDFANVTIQNGKVVMNNSTSELYFNNGIDNITIDNVLVTSATGTTNNSHQGIDIRSDGNITVTNSTFEQGYYGLYASRGATSPNLNISNCTFKYCSYGLRVYNGGLTADGCTVEYNTVRGIYCNSMDLAGTINNSTIRYQNGTGDYGLYYDGASTATLTMQYTSISSNYYGAMVNGSFNTLFKCNILNDNTDYGIYSYNSPVYLANATGISAGNNQLYSNNYGIKIYGTTSMFYLDNGYNELRSDTYCMYGTLEGIAGGSIAANNNYWKTGGGTPVSGTNYVLNGSLSPITLTDNSPESAFYLCETPGDMLEGAATTGTTEETSTYRTVTTDLGILPLNETVEATLNSDAETGTVYDDETQFDLMAQTLNNNLAALTTAEEKQATHTYRMFRSNLGKQIAEKGTVDAVQLENMLQVIEKLKADEKQSQGKKATRKHTDRYFALSMDEAQTLWLKKDYAGAIALLQELTAKATDDQLCEIQKMICQVEADREFVASNNTLDIEELLAQCNECNGSEKSGSIHSTGNGQQMVEQANLLGTDISLSVVPHPVTGTSFIHIKAPEDYQKLEIKLIDSFGKITFQQVIDIDFPTIQLSSSALSAGMYLVILSANNKPLISKRIVVINQ